MKLIVKKIKQITNLDIKNKPKPNYFVLSLQV